MLKGSHFTLDPSSIHRVLLVDLNFPGDMLLSSPVIRELKLRLANYPFRAGPAIPREYLRDIKIDVLCYDFCQPVVERNPYVDEIYTTQRRFPLWQAIKARFRGYDLVMQLNTSFQTNCLLLICGFGRMRLGYAYKMAGFPLNRRVPLPHRTARSGNRIRENLDLLERAFGWKIDNERMEFEV